MKLENGLHIMLDLETLGQTPGSVIASIGAVSFFVLPVNEPYIVSEFYSRINVESCIQAGLTMDASTVLWWMKQSDDARAELTNYPTEPLGRVLNDFRMWGNDWPNIKIWGNGASFDCALLGKAYDKMLISRPWFFWNERCFRTVKNLRPDVKEHARAGTKHNALDDARAQVRHLMRIFA